MNAMLALQTSQMQLKQQVDALANIINKLSIVTQTLIDKKIITNEDIKETAVKLNKNPQAPNNVSFQPEEGRSDEDNSGPGQS